MVLLFVEKRRGTSNSVEDTANTLAGKV